MIEQILQEARDSDYDFREIAHPADPLGHLFEEWVPYYRLKRSIAQVLEPKTILEIGVRFGYSAHAFLSACPTAKYIGIDNDSENFGGVRGALLHAKSILAKCKASFQTEDSQTLSTLPGELHDLIHVDGQQDGAGSYRDLELALAQGRHILVDGYFWSVNNFQESNTFLLRHQEVIEYAIILPGYAGELLIKTKEEHLQSQLRHRSDHTGNSTPNSSQIVNFYDSSNYLGDCGGHDASSRYQAEVLDDERLLAVLAMTGLKKNGNLLDLGCGRGEISYQAAKGGFQVIGIDYSDASLDLANELLERSPELEDHLSFEKGNAVSFAPKEFQDVVVAANLIEHLNPDEVELCYAKVASYLAPGGIFILHTFPNSWFYDYDYPRRRRAAAAAGAYLPAEPRTRFEKLMHVNEQNPRVMLAQLRRHFPYVTLWLGSPQDPSGSLTERKSPRQLGAYPNVFALASNALLPKKLLTELVATRPIPTQALEGRILLSLESPPLVSFCRKQFDLTIRIKNNSDHTLVSLTPHPIRLSYHWVCKDSGELSVFEGLRSALPRPLSPGCSETYKALCTAPERPGTYILIITIVQEGIAWWDESSGIESSLEMRIEDPSLNSTT